MSKERRSKAVIIQSALLGATLLLNGCIGMTYAKKTDSEGLVPIEFLGRRFPPDSSYYPEPAASKIGKHIKSTATPEEWAAIQCLGGAPIESVKLMNSTGYCRTCGGFDTLTETFRTALAHALEGSSSPPQDCAIIGSLKLQVTFLFQPEPVLVSAAKVPLFLAYMFLTLPGMGLLMPGYNNEIVGISAVATLAENIEVQAVGFGAATDVTTNISVYSEAGFIALAEALKSLATDLKKQADEQCKANEASPLTDSLRFRCGEAP